MKEPEYLLTYNASSYEWFDSEEELKEFVEENDLTSYEALYIPHAYEVQIED
ncbi:hypothetical protein GLW08_06505 [Pontibacillus yanchengensis]|uniref:Uncharacterized protein n=2 Tax=Pontibacillus yanchengensis TaxID=462910 RepID=A0ACC7VDD7_9BACI|nr:hypothetical protein [Pontibacillus yanchengensis]MYL32407.1 hypothetical protein [Pontibacillus yanchengensis]MYL52988.1 hypothetical protein [Pontibacillus yanchengensis]